MFKLFEIFKSILKKQVPPNFPKQGQTKPIPTINRNNELEIKIERVKKEKNKIKGISYKMDWYCLSVPKKRRMPIELYQAYKFGNVLNLKDLKTLRLQEAAQKQKIFDTKVNSLLDSIEKLLKNRDATNAKELFKKVHPKIPNVQTPSIKQRYQGLQILLDKLVRELEKEELARIVAENRHKEEQAQKQREQADRDRKERERKEQEERQRREEEAQRLAEEAKRKEEQYKKERERLKKLCTRKIDWEEFKKILEENNVHHLYHFTDERNIPSIKINGGLYSWDYCEKHQIKIPCPGGDQNSRRYDKKYKLEDYVRLSFCKSHPMAYRLKQTGSIIRILEIKTEVALWEGTLFSDMNAADHKHKHGGSLQDLKNVNFSATQRSYVSKDDADFKYHQAEVLVKTFIPLEYIEL